MKDSAIEIEATNELTHWWFVGRRYLFRKILEDLKTQKTFRVLDLGSGTGTNLRMVREMELENAVGLDINPKALGYCLEKGLGPVIQGDICNLPFSDNHFDLVIASDIIEHIDDDFKALREIQRILVKGGVALLVVPAFPILWGLQDEVSFHKRRYRMTPFLNLVRRADLKIFQAFHFNYILFPFILFARKIIKIFNIQMESEGEINFKILNIIFSILFQVDVRTAPILRPPFGVSVFVVAEK